MAESFLKNHSKTVIFPHRAQKTEGIPVSPPMTDDWRVMFKHLVDVHSRKVKQSEKGLGEFRIAYKFLDVTRKDDGSCAIYVSQEGVGTIKFDASPEDAVHLASLLTSPLSAGSEYPTSNSAPIPAETSAPPQEPTTDPRRRFVGLVSRLAGRFSAIFGLRRLAATLRRAS